MNQIRCKISAQKTEILKLIQTLKSEPELGTPIGKSCFKIRLAIKSKGKGKSGGARVVTYVYIEDEQVFLLSIYDKSEKENITDKELEELLSLIEE